jgi:hypothetical protein
MGSMRAIQSELVALWSTDKGLQRRLSNSKTSKLPDVSVQGHRKWADKQMEEAAKQDPYQSGCLWPWEDHTSRKTSRFYTLQREHCRNIPEDLIWNMQASPTYHNVCRLP